MKKILLLISALYLASLLFGCSILAPTKPNFDRLSWQEREAQLQHMPAWAIHGSLSVTYQNKRDLAHFVWEQNGDAYEITVYGPMNLNNVKITGDKTKVQLWQSTTQAITAKTPEQLFKLQYGWQMPIANMRYWVLALPAPVKIHGMCRDTNGYITNLSQQGWKITYSDFQDLEEMKMPTSIEMHNAKFTIKLKIHTFTKP